jgi:hypothetical protein
MLDIVRKILRENRPLGGRLAQSPPDAVDGQALDARAVGLDPGPARVVSLVPGFAEGFVETVTSILFIGLSSQ